MCYFLIVISDSTDWLIVNDFYFINVWFSIVMINFWFIITDFVFISILDFV